MWGGGVLRVKIYGENLLKGEKFLMGQFSRGSDTMGGFDRITNLNFHYLFLYSLF